MSRKSISDTNENDIIPQTIDQIKFLEKRKFVQSNKLIESIFEQPFKELELKILCLISKYINENKFLKTNHNYNIDLEQTMGSFLKINITKEEFCNFLNTNPSNFYKHLKILAKDLIKKSLLIESIEQSPKKDQKSFSLKKKFIAVTLFSAIACNEGKAVFCVNPVLQMYLQHLKSNFTVLSLEYISRMNSSHAIKIYQLLKKEEQKEKYKIHLEELKKILSISHAYENFTDLKKNVLEIAQKNINEKSDIEIFFRTKKNGRKVEEIEFLIKTKKTQLQQAIEKFKEEINQHLRINPTKLREQHQEFKDYWKETNKDIEKNLDLFNKWLGERIEDYNPSFHTKIKLKKESQTSLLCPIWYESFLHFFYLKNRGIIQP